MNSKKLNTKEEYIEFLKLLILCVYVELVPGIQMTNMSEDILLNKMQENVKNKMNILGYVYLEDFWDYFTDHYDFLETLLRHGYSETLCSQSDEALINAIIYETKDDYIYAYAINLANWFYIRMFSYYLTPTGDGTLRPNRLTKIPERLANLFVITFDKDVQKKSGLKPAQVIGLEKNFLSRC